VTRGSQRKPKRQRGGRPGGRFARQGRNARREDEPSDVIFIERATVREPIAVEVDRPQAYRPRLMGFWRGEEFYRIVRVIATRLEHDAIYHRVLTDRGAFDLRHIRVMNSLTLTVRRCWEVCAELDPVPVARLR
jgi:hypothetical protein